MKIKYFILLMIFMFFAVSCGSEIKFENPNDQNSEAYDPHYNECSSNKDCARNSYCDLDNPEYNTELETIVYHCKKRALCSSHADCQVGWKCKIDEGFCVTNEEAETLLCDSNADCQDPDRPVCDLKTGLCVHSETETDDSGHSEPDDDAGNQSGRKQGELYGECYPNKTCNEGLECDEANNICINETGDTGDTTPDGDSGDSGENQPDGDSGDSDETQPDDDSEPTDDDPAVCADCDGTGVKITGTVTLFHPTAIPSSKYSSLGEVQDGSEHWPPCETEVTLGDKSVYGTLVVNVNTKHIATVAEMDALNGITGTENFIQVNHSVAGEMGAAAFPKYSTGLTMSFFKTSTNSDTGETETALFIDDVDLINGNLSDTYAVRMFCVTGTVESGIKKIGPYTSDECIFYVLNFATDSRDACWHAIGVSDPDIVNDGLTFTVQ